MYDIVVVCNDKTMQGTLLRSAGLGTIPMLQNSQPLARLTALDIKSHVTSFAIVRDAYARLAFRVRSLRWIMQAGLQGWCTITVEACGPRVDGP